MSDQIYTIKELKSFRLMKFFKSSSDKGIAYVKVKSLDQDLCKRLQKLRSRYFIATSECYYNSPRDIANIASMSKYFDFHIVSCKRIGEAICAAAPGSKYVVLGAGEFMTSSDIFKVQNTGPREFDFISSANSFWSIKNFHKVLEMQKQLQDAGIKTTSRIICGSIKDKWYYKECKAYIKKHLPDQSDIVIGTSIDGLRDFYNNSKHLVHLSAYDSSPRVIFEAMLCGCHCILSGRWTESLNQWLQSPLIHVIPDDKYGEVKNLVSLPPNYELAKQYASQIGMVEVFPRISAFVRQELQSTFTDSQVIDQSCVGKVTFKQMEDEYSAEMRLIKRMI